MGDSSREDSTDDAIVVVVCRSSSDDVLEYEYDLSLGLEKNENYDDKKSTSG